jgi:hypothetical protein
VKYLEGMIIAAQRQKERNKRKESDTKSDTTPTSTVQDEKPSSSTETPPPSVSTPDAKEINIEPKTYCKLGHFHLLLENFSKGEFILLFIPVLLLFFNVRVNFVLVLYTVCIGLPFYLEIG